MLCLLAPAACVHNKPLLTITLQPGQLPGERTLILSPAFSAALELSLFTYLSLPGCLLTRVVKAGLGRKHVVLLLPSSCSAFFSAFSRRTFSLVVHIHCKLYPEGSPLEEARTASCATSLACTHEDLCTLWPFPLLPGVLDSSGAGGHRLLSPAPASGSVLLS